MNEFLNVQKYKEFKDDFHNKPVYTKADVVEMQKDWEAANIVNRVIQVGKDFDIALQIISVHRSPQGILVKVR